MKPEDKVFIKVKPKKNFVLVRVEVPARTIGGIIIPHHSKFDDDLRRVLVVDIGPEVKDIKKGDRGYVHFKVGYPVEKQYRNRVSDDEAEEFLLVLEPDLPAIFDYVTEADKADPAVIVGLAPAKIKHLQVEKVQKMEADGREAQGGGKIISIPGGLGNPGSQN